MVMDVSTSCFSCIALYHLFYTVYVEAINEYEMHHSNAAIRLDALRWTVCRMYYFQQCVLVSVDSYSVTLSLVAYSLLRSCVVHERTVMSHAAVVEMTPRCETLRPTSYSAPARIAHHTLFSQSYTPSLRLSYKQSALSETPSARTSPNSPLNKSQDCHAGSLISTQHCGVAVTCSNLDYRYSSGKESRHQRSSSNRGHQKRGRFRASHLSFSLRLDLRGRGVGLQSTRWVSPTTST